MGVSDQTTHEILKFWKSADKHLKMGSKIW
jgi:hypothetical protein